MSGAETILSNVENTARRICELLENYDFSSFLLGVRLPDELADQSLKKEIAVKVGTLVSEKLGKNVDFNMPDITIIIDYTKNVETPVLHLEIRPLYVYGEYQKLSRDIPQTKWICPKCHGKGCPYCNFMGKLYPTSVEEEIGKPLLDLTGGRDTKFHGAGREDRDALMLGWRPFVIEVMDPIVRDLDWKYVERLINEKSNYVKVRSIRPSTREEVVQVKGAKFDKTYEAFVLCKDGYDKSKLMLVESTFSNIEIEQRTPKRVAHRRADKVRKRKVYYIKCEPIDGTHIRMVIKAESGTYIKELVSGDDGRTTPSVSSVLGSRCVVSELNVLEVHKK